MLSTSPLSGWISNVKIKLEILEVGVIRTLGRPAVREGDNTMTSWSCRHIYIYMQHSVNKLTDHCELIGCNQCTLKRPASETLYDRTADLWSDYYGQIGNCARRCSHILNPEWSAHSNSSGTVWGIHCQTYGCLSARRNRWAYVPQDGWSTSPYDTLKSNSFIRAHERSVIIGALRVSDYARGKWMGIKSCIARMDNDNLLLLKINTNVATDTTDTYTVPDVTNTYANLPICLPTYAWFCPATLAAIWFSRIPLLWSNVVEAEHLYSWQGDTIISSTKPQDN